MKLPTVYGHRGSRGTHFENTRASFLEAFEAAAPWIETDIRLTKDNVPIVFHDQAVSGRLCKLDGKILKKPKSVRSIVWDDLKQYQLGSYIDYRFPKQKLPEHEQIMSLESFLEFSAAQMPGMKLNLELKTLYRKKNLPNLSVFASRVAEAAEATGMTDKILVSSFDLNIIQYFREHFPNFAVSRLFNHDPLFMNKILRTRIKHVTIHGSLLTPDVVAKLKDKGVTVNVFTINRKKDWRQLVRCGVDGIITDFPRKLLGFLKQGDFSDKATQSLA